MIFKLLLTTALAVVIPAIILTFHEKTDDMLMLSRTKKDNCILSVIGVAIGACSTFCFDGMISICVSVVFSVFLVSAYLDAKIMQVYLIDAIGLALFQIALILLVHSSISKNTAIVCLVVAFVLLTLNMMGCLGLGDSFAILNTVLMFTWLEKPIFLFLMGFLFANIAFVATGLFGKIRGKSVKSRAFVPYIVLFACACSALPVHFV
ncbi:MAG: hypothetical protein RR415_10480 [Ruthenibacterium sp.]